MANHLTYQLLTVCGGSASGKSSVINEIRKCFRETDVCVISMDDYYREIEFQHQDELGVYNFDLPNAIDEDSLIKDLFLLSEGKRVDKQEYTFNNPDKISRLKHFNPAPVVIVEGLFTLWFKKLRGLTDYSVFVEADEKTCYQRRRARDLHERGIPEDIFKHQWKNHVLPAYSKYLQPFISGASLIINNNKSNDEGVEMLVAYIRKVLETKCK